MYCIMHVLDIISIYALYYVLNNINIYALYHVLDIISIYVMCASTYELCEAKCYYSRCLS